DRDLPGLLLLGGGRAAPTPARRGGAGAVADEVLRLLAAGGALRGDDLFGDLLGRRIGLRLVVLGGIAGRAGCVGRAVGRAGGGRAARGVDLDQPGADGHLVADGDQDRDDRPRHVGGQLDGAPGGA